MSGFHTANLYAEAPTVRSTSGQTAPIDVDAYSLLYLSIHVTDWGDGWATDGQMNWYPEMQDANGVWASAMDQGHSLGEEYALGVPVHATAAPVTLRANFGPGLYDGPMMLPQWFRVRWELPADAAPTFQISVQATASDT